MGGCSAIFLNGLLTWASVIRSPRALIYLKLWGAWQRDRGDQEGGQSLRERVSSKGLVVQCLEAFPEGGEPRGEVQRRPTKEGS